MLLRYPILATLAYSKYLEIVCNSNNGKSLVGRSLLMLTSMRFHKSRVCQGFDVRSPEKEGVDTDVKYGGEEGVKCYPSHSRSEADHEVSGWW